MAFTSIVIFEWFFAFQSRSPAKGVWELGFLGNRWLLMCMVLGLGQQMFVVYLPLANDIFHTRPLTHAEWLWTLLPGVSLVMMEAVRKRFAPNLFGAGQWTPLIKNRK